MVTTQTGVLTDDKVLQYHRQGFLALRGVLAAEEVATFRAVAEELLAAAEPQIWGASADQTQVLYVEAAWRKDARLRQLALHPAITAVAERLAGVPLRLYGTDILMKNPEVHLATVVHDDEAGLPLDDAPHTLTAWVPLDDVPAERGCLTYLPGSHLRSDENRQIRLAGFEDYRPLEQLWPTYPYQERVAVPARVGDVLLHHNRTVHMAGVNSSDKRRLAFASVYMDDGARYRPGVQDHPVAHLQPGTVIEGADFPLVRE